MGQGIKGMIGIKGKTAIVIMLLVFVFSIFFLINPRDQGVVGNISGRTESLKLEKLKADNNYYISFLRYGDDKKVTKLKCTKEQYDFIINGEKDYHIFYRLNFFNKKAGKILELDDKPINHGGLNVALYNENNGI